MELHNIEALIEKYFQGETSIAEENELKNYFSSPGVAQHLVQYQPLFSYFVQASEEKSVKQIPLQSKKRYVAWLSVAASIVVLLGIAFTFFNNNSQPEDLGTFDNPETAFRETQKALALLSGNVNKGIEGMQYVQKYEETKGQVFIKD
ncbi:MAG: hypothetical protein EOO48_12540 [Flavobacterium sp.]|nr:MAG: hypothetical protein EOO48_12540 [Flavobacterium sp.]